MKKTLIVVLEVEVADLSAREREECAKLESIEPEEIACLKEVEASELGCIIAESLPQLSKEMFEGSNVYVNFAAAVARAAVWSPSVEQRHRNWKRISRRALSEGAAT